ncbi:TMEM165/GDT1 family protein [Sphingomonas sp. Tas61C01]|uniref:TMEM165/GDT1 family protein n=1 Tax=Sphingomonas sp. Tas61C01 TaxID=3458297 RepID=UPI00403E3907
MDALMAALVAAAGAQVGDRTAWLAAILADRCRSPLLVAAIAAFAVAIAATAATAAGILLVPRLTPEAKQLLLALALIAQGGGAVFRTKPPGRLHGWRLGTVATSFVGLLALAIGGGVPFIVLAIAARSAVPWLAPVGAVIGSLAVILPAATLGEGAWRALPLRTARTAIGAVFAIVGVAIGLAAMGLV